MAPQDPVETTDDGTHTDEHLGEAIATAATHERRLRREGSVEALAAPRRHVEAMHAELQRRERTAMSS